MQPLARPAAGGNRDRARAEGFAAGDIVSGVTNHIDAGCIKIVAVFFARTPMSKSAELIAVVMIIGEGAELEEMPEMVVFEFQLRAASEVTGEKCQHDVLMRLQATKQLRDSRQDATARTRQLVHQTIDVNLRQSRHVLVVRRSIIFAQNIANDRAVGFSGDLEVAQIIVGTEMPLHHFAQRDHAGAARIHEGAVDVEKKKALLHFRSTISDCRLPGRIAGGQNKSEIYNLKSEIEYRGRIAPSPTRYLHLGHAMTFWRAQERARAFGGQLILRIENLDRTRCRPEFTVAAMEDLRWFDITWDEGPDVGGSFAPYVQSERRSRYLAALEKLRTGGFIYPCICSRKDVLSAASAPHDEQDEPIYPGTCRLHASSRSKAQASSRLPSADMTAHWRFQVPDGEELSYVDERLGLQTAIAGHDFGDFIVWQRDDIPAYQLAVVVDDAAMRITEVVRGEDLLLSTFRQLLLYNALGLAPPKFFHSPLILDRNGKRFAKRGQSTGLRALRARGLAPRGLRV